KALESQHELQISSAMHLTRPKPLDSSITWNDLYMMTNLAQMEDTDHETRLLPVISEVMLKQEDSCCINAMILNYYLKHILHADEHVDKKYPHIRFVRSDLQRIAHILKPHCVSVQKLFDHFNQLISRYVLFGETIILFHYLFESCNARM
uniref:Uncharacterized protein n=1 Tax=Sinocyclocheilus grahami TaxID=75366 RepID=A0A672JXX4_SINGR